MRKNEEVILPLARVRTFAFVVNLFQQPPPRICGTPPSIFPLSRERNPNFGGEIQNVLFVIFPSDDSKRISATQMFVITHTHR